MAKKEAEMQIPEEDLYVLSDDEGEDISFRQIGRIEVDGIIYAMLELVDDDEGSAMIFEVGTDEDGDECMTPVDEELADDIFYMFLSENEDYEYGDAE